MQAGVRPGDRSAPSPASAASRSRSWPTSPTCSPGSIDADAADKAAHFITVADSFHLPLVFLADNPGMLPGTHSEREGILRSGARMFAAQTLATTPKVHVTLRKAYGFGSMVMSMVGFDDQSATFAFPGATLGAMGAAASAGCHASRRRRPPRSRHAELDGFIPFGGGLGFDELIDPREAATPCSVPWSGSAPGARRPGPSPARHHP